MVGLQHVRAGTEREVLWVLWWVCRVSELVLREQCCGGFAGYQTIPKQAHVEPGEVSVWGMYTYTLAHTHTHIHTQIECTHSYTHMHTHTHMHTQLHFHKRSTWWCVFGLLYLGLTQPLEISEFSFS